MKILLVSGNPRVNQQVKTALVGRDDVEIVEVGAPERAVQLIDGATPPGVDDEAELRRLAGPYDIVVGDNDTHPTGGLYLAREIKARGQMGRDMPPVVLLLAREQDVWLSNWSQADAYVLKPVDPFDLAEVLDALVAGAPVPQLPRIGGDPTPSLLDVPGGTEAEGIGAIGGGAPGMTGGGP